MRRWLRRIRFAREFHEWPWNVPWSVVDGVGTKRPPEHVFEAFRRLHGITSETERSQPGSGA